MEKTIEDYKSLVELLKQALLFYANDRNYEGKDEQLSLMVVDSGSQARFALAKIKEFTEVSEKLEADYLRNMNEAIESGDSPENVLKIIEGFKKIANGDD